MPGERPAAWSGHGGSAGEGYHQAGRPRWPGGRNTGPQPPVGGADPQIFRRGLYRQAAEQAAEHGLDFTDDCQLVESIGQEVYLSMGDYRNMKITTPEDLIIARALLEEWE